jgi:hypothetical protein
VLDPSLGRIINLGPVYGENYTEDIAKELGRWHTAYRFVKDVCTGEIGITNKSSLHTAPTF